MPEEQATIPLILMELQPLSEVGYVPPYQKLVGEVEEDNNGVH